MALSVILAIAAPAGRAPRAGAAGCALAGSAPYLHTCGTQIVDANGNPVVLHALNWYGFDSNDFVAGGLKYQSYQAIIARIKALGYNALRIPFSNEMVERNPVVSSIGPICVRTSCLPETGADVISANPSLTGMTALDILKTIVDYAGQQGLYVILDDHRSEAAWGPEEDGLWYTATSCDPSAPPFSCFTPQSWVSDWITVGRLFQNDPNVIGMDLRNEPHAVFQPSNCTDYLNYAHWGTCNGQNNAVTDWPEAATQSGDNLLALNPHWLIMVEGISSYPQGNGGFSADGWGENLQGVVSDPVTLNVANQLVYSPHDYEWDQTDSTTATMESTWYRNFSFIGVPGQPYSAPLWVGEFGTCTNANNCISDTEGGNSYGWWFSSLASYLNNPPSPVVGPLSWAYWPANGTYSDSWSYVGAASSQKWQTCYGQREGYGVLWGDWVTPSDPLLQSVLMPPVTPTPAPTNTASPTASATQTPAPTSSAVVSATATVVVSATATAAPTDTPSDTASPAATQTPAATPSPAPPWPSVACAPYTVAPTATPTVAAPPPPPPPPPPPTATPTDTPSPSPTPTHTPVVAPSATPAPSPTWTATPISSRHGSPAPPPRKHSHPRAPLIALRAWILHHLIWLDVELRRDLHGRLSGWLHLNDRVKGLTLTQAALRSAATSCGRYPAAVVQARLHDRHHTYDITLRLAYDKHRHVQVTLHLGRILSFSTTVTSKLTITCSRLAPVHTRKVSAHKAHKSTTRVSHRS